MGDELFLYASWYFVHFCVWKIYTKNIKKNSELLYRSVISKPASVCIIQEDLFKIRSLALKQNLRSDENTRLAAFKPGDPSESPKKLLKHGEPLSHEHRICPSPMNTEYICSLLNGCGSCSQFFKSSHVIPMIRQVWEPSV